MARDELGVDARPRLREAHVVGVRVEDDDPKRRVQEQPFEEEAERVRLA